MTTKATIGEIVTTDYRAAGVLDTFGIDFCRTGKKTLEEVCGEQHLDELMLEKALTDLNNSPGHQNPHWNFSDWDTRFLVEFIVHTHHNYIRESMPELLRLGKIVSGAPGPKHAAMQEVLILIQKFEGELKRHLEVEEQAMFPYILDMESVRDHAIAFVEPKFGRVESPIRQLENQHELAVNVLQEIRTLTGDYIPPAGAWPEHRTWYVLLKEFDADMHLHLHLENNILFPRALALEAELLACKGFTTIWFG